jgi:hypothetical protein
MKQIFAAALGCAVLAGLWGHAAAAQDAIAPPPGLKLLLAAHAEGVQAYVCTEKDTAFVWVFDGPSAALFNDRGRQIGVHEKGPIWTLGDGSGVTAERVVETAAPDAGSIPWLLGKVKAHVGTFGALTGAAYVRRIDTRGGAAPPDGCDAERRGDVARIHYSAVYQFYGE